MMNISHMAQEIRNTITFVRDFGVYPMIKGNNAVCLLKKLTKDNAADGMR